MSNSLGRRGNTIRLQPLQQWRIQVRDAERDEWSSFPYFCQRYRVLRRHFAVHCRNAMFVRIKLRVPEHGGNPLLETLRDGVFEPLGLFVDSLSR